jgi:hypothetical protein
VSGWVVEPVRVRRYSSEPSRRVAGYRATCPAEGCGWTTLAALPARVEAALEWHREHSDCAAAVEWRRQVADLIGRTT